MNNPEPTLTRSVLAGIIAAAALLVIARLNRAVDLFDGGELDQAKALLALAAPVIAGFLIRGKVTPTSRVQEHVDFGVAAGYAQALEDNPPPALDVVAQQAVAAPAKRAPAKKKAAAPRR